MFDDKIEWGKQEILNTTNRTPEEAEQNAVRIKLDTMRECSKPITPTEFNGLYEIKIKDWCSKHKK